MTDRGHGISAETVPIHLVQRLMRTAEGLGLDVPSLLHRAGISTDVAHNRRARVTLGQLGDLTRVIWATTDDELFGVGPERVPLGTFRLIARSTTGGVDLREMLIRVDQASRVITALPRITTQIGSEEATVTIDVSRLDDPEHLATDTLAIFVHRTLSWAIGRRVVLTRMQVPYPEPRHLRYYAAAFGLVPTFDAERLSYSFDAAMLDAPLLRSDADLDEWIDGAPTNYFSTRDWGSGTQDQVRRILETGLQGDWPSPDDVAARLSVSAHHLRRLLREEGTSMTEIKEDLLRDAAISSLVTGKESVEDLSARLGFSEASAFRRAFRRWTGMPPGSYRAGVPEGE